MADQLLTAPAQASVPYSDGPIWNAFGLTRAAYLVVPRRTLQSMPQEWQERFVALMAEAYERLRDWRRLNQPVRSARTVPEPTESDNVLQFNLGLAEPAGRRTRARANVQGGCP